jgi:hypothetical protein
VTSDQKKPEIGCDDDESDDDDEEDDDDDEQLKGRICYNNLSNLYGDKEIRNLSGYMLDDVHGRISCGVQGVLGIR